jgi:hypothetical protein
VCAVGVAVAVGVAAVAAGVASRALVVQELL